MRTAPVYLVMWSFAAAYAAEWPQYLGPNGDLSSPESIRSNWAESPPKQAWRRPIGPGFSSMAVSSGRVVTLARRSVNGRDREVCLALNAETGEEVWAKDVDVANYTSLSGYDDRMDGPRSTPTFANNRVYVFTSQLKLFCLDAATGTEIWHRDFPAELGSSVISWENAASALLVNDLLFVNCNAAGRRLMAVRASDGTTAWSGEDSVMTHATPVFARIGDVAQVIFLTRDGLVAVVPESGRVLWRLPFSPSSTSTAASPAVAGEYVYASAAYASGTWMARVTRQGDVFTANQAWRQQGTAYQAHWSTPVVQDGFVYHVPSPSSGQGRLACLDVGAGANRWVQASVGSGPMGFGSVIRAANALVVLTEGGEMVLVRADPTAYVELARFQVLSLYCWNHAVLSNGRIYARSTSASPEIIALNVGEQAQPPLALSLEIERNPSGSLTLFAVPAEGQPADSTVAALLEIISSANISAPIEDWTVLDATFTAVAGGFMTEIAVGNEPARYLRVRLKNSGD